MPGGPTDALVTVLLLLAFYGSAGAAVYAGYRAFLCLEKLWHEIEERRRYPPL